MQSNSAADDPLIGTTLSGRYKVLARIGEGGMGIVYEAEHIVIEKRVALKVLRDEASSRPEVVERFRREARSASRIGHAHIVDISDFGETPGGHAFFVMEKLDGEDLADVLERETVVAPERALHIALQCARALGAAHAKGIVHRDMKPENIFLITRDSSDDFVKLVDFGIAKMSDLDAEAGGGEARKLTKTGMIFGTPEYMSPEQASGKKLDHRVDIYALGVILYEMFAGRVPFVGDTFMGILTQHLFEQPPPIRQLNPNVHLSTDLENIIMQALHKDPAQRFQSMEIFGAAMLSVPEASAMAARYGIDENDSSVSSARRVMAELGQSPESTYRGGDTGWRKAMGLPTKKKSRSRVKQLLGLAVAAAFAAGLYVVTQSKPQDGALADSGAQTAPKVQVTTTPPTTAKAADPAPAKDAPKPKVDRIEIRVETNPAGAELFVEGRGKLCLRTPCAFETKPGDEVILYARRGRASARESITPSKTTTVSLKLTAPTTKRRPRRRDDPKPKRTTKQSTKTPEKKKSASDLKVPDFL